MPDRQSRLLDDLFREKSEAYCIMLAKSEKIALFSEGVNLYTAVKSLGLDIDYKRLPVSFSRAVICYGLLSYRRVRGSRRRFNSAADPLA